jgi:hypothetical protein
MKVFSCFWKAQWALRLAGLVRVGLQTECHYTHRLVNLRLSSRELLSHRGQTERDCLDKSTNLERRLP